MEIIAKETEVQIGTLGYGDVCQTTSGSIFMVVNGRHYVREEDTDFTVVVVDLERGMMDRMRPFALVRPMKLVAKEE